MEFALSALLEVVEILEKVFDDIVEEGLGSAASVGLDFLHIGHSNNFNLAQFNGVLNSMKRA